MNINLISNRYPLKRRKIKIIKLNLRLNLRII